MPTFEDCEDLARAVIDEMLQRNFRWSFVTIDGVEYPILTSKSEPAPVINELSPEWRDYADFRRV